MVTNLWQEISHFFPSFIEVIQMRVLVPVLILRWLIFLNITYIYTQHTEKIIWGKSIIKQGGFLSTGPVWLHMHTHGLGWVQVILTDTAQDLRMGLPRFLPIQIRKHLAIFGSIIYGPLSHSFSPWGRCHHERLAFGPWPTPFHLCQLILDSFSQIPFSV